MPQTSKIRLLPLMLILALPAACTGAPDKTRPDAAPPAIDTRSERARSTVVPPSPAAPGVPAATGVPADATTHYAMCGGQVRDMADVLRPIVDRLVAQRIPYARSVPGEWRDCSGNFLRLSSAVAAACPDRAGELIAPPGVRPYAAGGNNVVPFNVPYRSSRAVASWYAGQGRLVPIYYDDAPGVTDVPQDLLRHRHLIRPGAVVWFSRGRPVSALGLDQLFADPSTPNNINHMGTVTRVTRNARGEVIRYTMYHGHGKEARGTPASETTNQYFAYPASLTRSKSYPPLGYWSQRIVAVGTLLPVTAAVAAL